jgi:hypothetical protein
MKLEAAVISRVEVDVSSPGLLRGAEEWRPRLNSSVYVVKYSIAAVYFDTVCTQPDRNNAGWRRKCVCECVKYLSSAVWLARSFSVRQPEVVCYYYCYCCENSKKVENSYLWVFLEKPYGSRLSFSVFINCTLEWFLVRFPRVYVFSHSAEAIINKPRSIRGLQHLKLTSPRTLRDRPDFNVHRLRTFVRWEVRRGMGVTGDWRKLHKEELQDSL